MPDPVAPLSLPRWLHLAAGQDRSEAQLLAAGAALALIDGAARDEAPPAGLWRSRLALAAAAANARMDGRPEDEAALRDAVLLTRSGDDPGPGGRLLQAWQALGESRALRSAEWASRLPRLFDLAASERLSDLLTDAARLPGRVLPLRPAALAAAQLIRLGPGYRGLGLWVADATMARALGWARPVPLLAAHLPRRAIAMAARGEDEDFLLACAGAWANAAMAALDLRAGLLPRAAALQAAKLRGRDAKAVVAELLSQDAVTAHAGAMASDRAARRIFDRLTAHGLVRELSGRASFRIYGL